ncbi:hypothetical protein D3C87_1745780 [compost metagenome]
MFRAQLDPGDGQRVVLIGQETVIQVQTHPATDTAHGIQHAVGICRYQGLHCDPTVLITQIGRGELRQALGTVAEMPLTSVGADARAWIK